MRLIIVGLFLIIFVIFCPLLFFIEWIVGKINMEAKQKSSLAIVKWAFRVILFLSGVKVDVIGEENVPKDKAVLYVGNHHGIFDVLVTYVRVPGLTGFVAKKEIEKVPVLRTWMRHLNCLFLDRKDLRAGAKMIIDAIQKIKSGVSIFIFPEGTRSKDENVTLPFHEGSFKIATKANCPIVPVVLTNTNRIFEDHFPWIKKTHVTLEYCEPIILDEMPDDIKRSPSNYVRNIIVEKYEKNRGLM